MARLPNPGGDNGTWGVILNDYLNVSLDSGGFLNSGTVGTNQLTTSSVTTAKIADSSVTTAKLASLGVANGVASLGSDGYVPNAQLPTRLAQASLDAAYALKSATLSNPTTETWASVTINDDGSSTGGWIDRFRITFVPQSGSSRPTFWLNEYGEARGMPGKDNTVAARFFAALNSAGYTARSGTVPVLEVTDQRDGTRTTIFGVYKGGRVTMTRLEANETRTSAATTPLIVQNLNYTITTGDSDHLRILVQGVAKFWMNEWGAIRGTSPYTWGDALVRAIRDNGDGITAGNAFEVVDRRTGAPSAPNNVMFGVSWTDGSINRNGVSMAMSYVLESTEDETDIPAHTPPGTIIFRKAP